MPGNKRRLKELLEELKQNRFVDAPCLRMTNQFFGPDIDGRMDAERPEREAACKAICAACVYRLPCLEQAVVWERSLSSKDVFGVSGGMGEGERRRFHQHLKSEGYTKDVPRGQEFLATIWSFYKEELNRRYPSAS